MRRLSIKQCISTPCGLVSIVGANVVLLARYALSSDCLDALDKAFEASAENYPSFGFFSLLEVGIPLPRSRGEQERMQGLLEQHASSVSASVVVFEGVGFEATMVRSGVTAVNMAGRVRHPSRVFSQQEGAVLWMLGHAAGKPTQEWKSGQSGVPQADPKIVADLSSAISLLRSSWKR